MFKSTKNDGRLAELENELAGKRTSARRRRSATSRKPGTGPIALAEKVARTALTGDLDLQNLESELRMRRTQGSGFCQCQESRLAPKFANLKRG